MIMSTAHISFIVVSSVRSCEECSDDGSGCLDLGFLGSICFCRNGYEGNGTTCEGINLC